MVTQQQGGVAERLSAASLRQQLLARSDVLADHAEPEPPPFHHVLPPAPRLDLDAGPLWSASGAPAGGFRTWRWRRPIAVFAVEFHESWMIAPSCRLSLRIC
jgi:hypothetical protein